MSDEERKDGAKKTLTVCWKEFVGNDVDLKVIFITIVKLKVL